MLITDYTSRIPAVVRRGRWWGIARGNLAQRARSSTSRRTRRCASATSSLPAKAARSTPGVPIGTVTAIERGDATLYQTAVVKPAVDLGALDRVVVVPR